MAGDITKFDFSDNLRNNLGLQNVQPPINKVASFVQPVAEIIKFSNIVRSNNATATGTSTVYTIPADKDFYLTGVSLGLTKDIACDNVSAYVVIRQDGAPRRIIMIPSQTLTVYTGLTSLSFPYPIKLDKSSLIELTCAWTVGTASVCCSITGFQI